MGVAVHIDQWLQKEGLAFPTALARHAQLATGYSAKYQNGGACKQSVRASTPAQQAHQHLDLIFDLVLGLLFDLRGSRSPASTVISSATGSALPSAPAGTGTCVTLRSA